MVAKGQERSLAYQVSLVTQHGVPEVVGVAQPIANPAGASATTAAWSCVCTQGTIPGRGTKRYLIG